MTYLKLSEMLLGETQSYKMSNGTMTGVIISRLPRYGPSGSGNVTLALSVPLTDVAPEGRA